MLVMLPPLATSPITWGFVGNGRWGIDLPQERILSEMAEIGFSATEAGVPGFLPSKGQEAKSALDRHGLQAVSGPVSFIIHEEDSLKNALDAVRLAGQRLLDMGGEVLITVPKPGNLNPGEKLTDDGWTRLGEGLDSVEELCSSMGLRQALHPHVGSLVETKEDMERVIESSACGWCLDTAHIASGNFNLEDFMTLAGERVALVHIKDLDLELGRQMVHHEIKFDDAIAKNVFVPLGDGDLDLAGTLPLLPRDVWWVLEQDQAIDKTPQAGRGPKIDAARSLQILQDLLKGD